MDVEKAVGGAVAGSHPTAVGAGLGIIGRTGPHRLRIERLGTSARPPTESTALPAPPPAVATAYKLLLRRSPDPEGLKCYEGRVDRGFTIDELASAR